MCATTIAGLATSAALLAAGGGPEHQGPPPFDERWFYLSTNFQVDDNVPRAIELVERAGRAGYTAVVLADYKLNFLDRVPDRYFGNIERFRRAAEEAGVELIPAIFPVGYSSGLLSHDPNLAEGLPAVSRFVVRGTEAVPEPAPGPLLVNGGLERTAGEGGDRFAGFSSQDEPGRSTFADAEVHRPGGRLACRMEIGGAGRTGPNCRLIQQVEVRPRAAYRLSAWVKTDGFGPTGAFRLLAIGAGEGGRPLTFHEGGVEPTQDWKQVEVVFNTLDRDRINVYAGVWGEGTGTVWLDDLAVEELPLVNVLRRSGCPLTVRAADGSETYEEGKDYEPVVDPKLGQVPYAGEFEFGHAGAPLRLRPGSRIADGQRLEVEWYHPVIVHGFQVACCLSEPKVYDLLADQARRVCRLLQPRTVFMSHDELRVANWCRACRDRQMSAGELLADNAGRCLAILAEVDPTLRVAVWSDMFDPHHNAQANYYLVRGTLEGSWEGLPPSVVIANWNSGRGRESLQFFADRGHPQVIAGYYDADDLGDLRRWTAAARGVPGVIGFMYTTWRERYDLLESYGREAAGPPVD